MMRLLEPTPTRGRAPSHSPPDLRYNPAAGMGKFLGWFSVGLGLMEILAHRPLARWLGVRDHAWVLPVLGGREILTGLGILTRDRAPGWLWTRVAGDAMDLSLLGTALALPKSSKKAIGIAALAVLGATALDALCATEQTAAASLEG